MIGAIKGHHVKEENSSPPTVARETCESTGSVRTGSVKPLGGAVMESVSGAEWLNNAK